MNSDRPVRKLIALATFGQGCVQISGLTSRPSSVTNDKLAQFVTQVTEFTQIRAISAIHATHARNSDLWVVVAAVVVATSPFVDFISDSVNVELGFSTSGFAHREKSVFGVSTDSGPEIVGILTSVTKLFFVPKMKRSLEKKF